MKDTLKLFASSVIVKGPLRSMLIDTHRNAFFLIPNDFYDLLEVGKRLKVAELKTLYRGEDLEVIDEYVDFLLEKELAFWTDEPELFPEIEEEHLSPEKVTNAVIDIKPYTILDWNSLAQDMDKLKCKHLQLRFFYCPLPTSVTIIFEALQHTLLRSIEVVAEDNEGTEGFEFWKAFGKEHQRISRVFLYNSDSDAYQDIRGYNFQIINIRQKLDFPYCCGVVKPGFFTSALEHVIEAKNHNTCLNKKISIDSEGNIKNCPSMATSFGNIKDISLTEAIQHPEFKKYWNISKNDVKVCQDCEFRRVCTDCRAYTENPEDIYSKPLKCGYDPYTAKWEDWDKNPIKQETFEYYKGYRHATVEK